MSGSIRGKRPQNEASCKGPNVSKQLRSRKKDLWLVGYTLDELTGCKLPLNLAVLRRFSSLREANPRTKIRCLAKTIFEEMTVKFWLPSRVPMKGEKNCIDLIENVFHEYEMLRKTPVF